MSTERTRVEQGSVEFLMLLVTGRCNLHCRYCFAEGALPGEDMPGKLAVKAVRRYMSKGKPGVVEFAGGEPLLAFSVIQECIEGVEREYRGLRFAVQTNGTVAERDIWDYLKKKEIGVAVSLDGVPDVNDIHRGRGKEVVRTLTLLGYLGMGANITAVVTKQNVSRMEDFLLLCGVLPSVRVINLDILRPKREALDTEGFEESDLIPGDEEIGEMAEILLQTLEYVNRKRFPPLRVREVEQVRRGLLEGKVQSWGHGGSREHRGLRKSGCDSDFGEGASLPPFCHVAKGSALAVTPEGMLYPCASFLGDCRHSLGRVGEEDFSVLEDLMSELALPESCGTCEAVSLCRGGCPSRRVAYSGTAQGRPGPECTLYRELLRRIEK